MDVDLRVIRAFVVVAETQHFGRAAEQLFLSQPAVSQQVRRLEQGLGLTLFERDRRSVALTPAGAALLDVARAALAAAGDFGSAAERLRRTEHGELVVGFHVRWPFNFLPRVLRRFRELLPAVDVQLVQHEFLDTSAGLRTGSSDVALLHLPIVDDGLEVVAVACEERVALVARDHPLAGASHTSVAELVATGTPWAVPSDNDPIWRDFWSAADERAAVGGGDVGVIQPATQDALFQVIASGAGMGLSYRGLVESQRPAGIAALAVDDLGPTVLAVGWRVDDDRTPVTTFGRCVRDAVDQGGHDASMPAPTRQP